MTEIYQNNTSNRSDDYLDMEYLTTLRNIKPYITCIMNNHYIELIRVWLEKLSDTNVQNDKALRNTYLVELGKQIVSGVFVEPFIDPPGDGTLPPFKNSWRFSKDKLQNVTTQENNDPWARSDSNNVSTQVIVDSTKCSSQTVSEEVTALKPGKNEKSFPFKGSKEMSSPKSQLHDVREKLALVREYSKQMCKGSRIPKKKKSKTKRQLNIHTVPQRKISEETDIFPHTNFEQPRPSYNAPFKEVRVYSPLRKLQDRDRKFNETDDSSWFDLTDCSTTATAVFCSGDGDISSRVYEQDDVIHMQELYEKKIAELMNLIGDLKNENSSLSSHVDKYEKELRTVKANTNLSNLAHEVEGLKNQLQDLINIKLNLQSSHVGVSSEWQSTVSTLHKKLALLQRKANDLKLENSDLTRKMEEQEADKRKELIEQKKKISEMYNKETDMLKQIHARAITDMEAKYTQKMTEQEIDFQKRLDDIKRNYENRFNNLKEDYDSRINSIKQEYESRLNSVSMDYEKALSNKDSEIDRLERMVQEQCARMQEEVHMIRSQIESSVSSNNESHLEKIAFLQKCILKMERLYQKAEKENAKHIAKLKRQLEFRDKSNQLALTTQRADLLSHTVNGKQNEIDLVVCQLEEYYKKKLSENQQRAMEEKRQDNKLIAQLKDQLSKLSNEY